MSSSVKLLPGIPEVQDRVYVAGPMRGYDCFNFAAFDDAAARLREAGWEVFCPAEHDREGGFDETLNSLDGFDMAKAFRWDVESILQSDAIAMLPGWQKSQGATLEYGIAKMIGLTILDAVTLEPLEEESPLAEAHRLVHGDRNAAYGEPIDDFSRTGRMWGAILGIDDVPAELVGLCMVAVKVSRQVNAPKRDNLVDMAGYAETVDMVVNERARRALERSAS